MTQELEHEVGEAGRRIRNYLDSERVLQAALEEVCAALEPPIASVWTGGGRDHPTLVRSVPVDRDSEPPDAVITSGRRWETVIEDHASAVAVPAFAPRSGVVAIFHLEGRPFGASEIAFVEAIASEAAHAFEAARIFERAVAEKEKSEAVLARIGDGVIVTDPQGRILDWNPAAARIVGWTGEGSPQGLACRAVLGLRLGDRELDCENGCALLSLRAAGEVETGHGLEVARTHPNGRRQPLLADVEPIRAPEGGVAEVVHSFRDVSRLKEADEAKSLFLATASHELKTPLTVIMGFASTLVSAGEQLSPEVRDESLRAIERRAIELSTIVDGLLMASRIESGRVDLDIIDVVLAPLLRERVAAAQAMSGRSVVLELAELPTVSADPQAVATIVDQLIDNALKYSPNGGAVTVTTRTDGRDVEIAVSDQGMGMDAEQLEHCFEKFWQAESTDIRRFGGTGIGLYIVRSLTEAMGGSVRVESAPGVGTTFRVSLRARSQ